MFFQNIILFCNVVPCNVVFLCETCRIQWIFTQHCGYWWPGALAPGHQYLQCWICTHHCCLWVNTVAQGWGNAEKLHQLTMSLTHRMLIYGKCQGLPFTQQDNVAYLCFQSTCLWWSSTSTTIPTQQYETSLEADSKYIPWKLPTVLALFLTEKTMWNLTFTLSSLKEILADLNTFVLCSRSNYFLEILDDLDNFLSCSSSA